MERKILYSDKHLSQMLEDFKHADVEKQRFLAYQKVLQSTNRVIKYETDEKLCYFLETLTPKFGTKGYINRSTTEGFTFDKTKKKLSIWYGKKLIKMSHLLISTMMSDLYAEWYNLSSNHLRMVATRMLFEKIFKGTINSPSQFCESYVKHHLKIKGLDWLGYYSLTLVDSGISVGELNMMLRYASDPNDVLKNYAVYRYLPNIQYVINYCQTLGKTFDWSLSQQTQGIVLAEMREAVDKIRKEYDLVKEFYSYALKPYETPQEKEAREKRERDQYLPF